MEEKPKSLWKEIDTDKCQGITIHIIVDNYNNIFMLQLK